MPSATVRAAGASAARRPPSSDMVAVTPSMLSVMASVF
jgi:hypothetical protein